MVVVWVDSGCKINLLKQSKMIEYYTKLNDADVLFFQIGNDPEKALHLLRGECGTRFVHNKDAGFLRKRFGNLYDLLLSNTQLVAGRFRGDMSTQLFK